MTLQTLCFDADDTLWHDDSLFDFTHRRFHELMAAYASPDHLEVRLQAAEDRNLHLYGYGVKGFTLSMIETALEVMHADAPVWVIGEILAAGRAMLGLPVRLLDGVSATLKALSGQYRLVLISRGELLNQEQKLASSGLGDLFEGVEIVSSKDRATYARLFARYGEAGTSAMIGNSLQADVLPAIEAGGWGVHIPYASRWSPESEASGDHDRFVRLSGMAELPAWLLSLN